MKLVENDFSFGVDNNLPGCTTGAVFSHNLRNFMGLWISGGMGHGDSQVPLQLVFSQFVLGIIFMAFKYGLYREKFDWIYIFKRLR